MKSVEFNVNFNKKHIKYASKKKFQIGESIKIFINKTKVKIGADYTVHDMPLFQITVHVYTLVWRCFYVSVHV